MGVGVVNLLVLISAVVHAECIGASTQAFPSRIRRLALDWKKAVCIGVNLINADVLPQK